MRKLYFDLSETIPNERSTATCSSRTRRPIASGEKDGDGGLLDLTIVMFARRVANRRAART